MIETSWLVLNERKIEGKTFTYVTQITTYECKIHKILNIRMKTEQFTKRKYDYGPEPWKTLRSGTHGKFYWNVILTTNK